MRHCGACELHHGDCIEADAEAHEIARALGWHIVGHPPTNPHKRAFCQFDEARPPAPYLVRNRHIVNETTALLATPRSFAEVIRSGTWATIRYARKLGRPVIVIYPNGSVR